MATMELDGYVARVDINDEDGTLHGRITNISDVITFEAKSVKELKREFRSSLADYFEFCEKRGGKPEKPFSGKFVIRVEPSLHGAIAAAAARDEKSINSWAKEKLAAAAGQ